MPSRLVTVTLVTSAGDGKMQFGHCRLHGEPCRTRWGWDREHTDSPRPYTLDELAARPDNPHFYAYPMSEEYQAGWRLWRALRLEGHLTPLEDYVRVLARAEILGGQELADQWRSWHPELEALLAAPKRETELPDKGTPQP